MAGNYLLSKCFSIKQYLLKTLFFYLIKILFIKEEVMTLFLLWSNLQNIFLQNPRKSKKKKKSFCISFSVWLNHHQCKLWIIDSNEKLLFKKNFSVSNKVIPIETFVFPLIKACDNYQKFFLRWKKHFLNYILSYVIFKKKQGLGFSLSY